jgi:hypothetical protein
MELKKLRTPNTRGLVGTRRFREKPGSERHPNKITFYPIIYGVSSNLSISSTGCKQGNLVAYPETTDIIVFP